MLNCQLIKTVLDIANLLLHTFFGSSQIVKTAIDTFMLFRLFCDFVIECLQAPKRYTQR